MNKEQAHRIIRNTFERSFDKVKFINFIKDLLNLKKEQIEHKHPYSGNYIPDAYEQSISTLERIAKYTDGENEIDLLIVKLKKEASLERARTMQRNFIAWYLKGSRGGKLKDAALVAFVSPDEEDWRFSLVKMDYRFEAGKAGIVKTKEEFTPARRWSFLVGKNEKSHTAQSRLVPILEDDDHNPTITQLEEAFNIETVTKEFFKEYRDIFIRTVDELDKIVKKDEKVRKDFILKNINTVDFAKKLLGQIVFLYFLQKKGWFGVERDSDWRTGPKDFLRRLFEKKYGDYKNFFNDILEPLFYEALARERDDNFCSRFNCKIPFLNGGLFEPIGGYDWVHTDILLPNELFSNSHKTPESDIGDGILDVFDRFNFTVKEDEPLEKEVAIDPELLGKLYEKFNAIRPDNFYEYKEALLSGKKTLEKKFNKQYGVYYTPREIVHYMCQEILINYLHTVVNQELIKQPERTARQSKLIGPEKPEQLRFHTDEEIVSKKAIEELIKYGEQFAENEAVALIKEQRINHGKQKNSDYKLQLSETIRENAKLIDEKLRDIKVCDPAVGSGAFPVGMMSEIVKARNVLTIFLSSRGAKATKQSQTGDHFSDAHDANRTIYNFKRECIEKSLYGVDIDLGACEVTKLRLWLSLVVDEEDIKNIKPLPNLDYKIIQGNSLISEFLGINFDIEDETSGTLKFKDNINFLIEQFQEKKNEFLSEPDRNKKEYLKQEIESLIIKIFEEKLKKQKTDYFSHLKFIEEKYSTLPNEKQRNEIIAEEKEKFYKKTGFNLEQVERQLKEYTSGHKVRPFFPWKLYFAEIFHQKKGFDVVIANPPYISFGLRGSDRAKKDWDAYIRKNYPNSAEYKLSTYSIFIDKGIQLLRGKGNICYITPDSYLLGRYFSKLRNYILNSTSIKQILMFETDFWQEGVIGRPTITLMQKNQKKRLCEIKLFKNLKEFERGFCLINSYSQEYFNNNKYKRFRLLFSNRAKRLVEIVEADSISLGNVAKITTGVRSKIGQKKIIADKQVEKSWKKGIISGAQVYPYMVKWEGHYLNIDKKLLWAGGWDLNIVENPKIMIRQTGDSLIAGIDMEGVYHLNNVHSLSILKESISLEYICAVLNSKLMNKFYQLISLERGRTMAQTDIDVLETLPIKIIEMKDQKKIIELVHQIIHNGLLNQTFEKIENLICEIYKLPAEMKKYAMENNLY